jgi:hypothetical protein
MDQLPTPMLWLLGAAAMFGLVWLGSALAKKPPAVVNAAVAAIEDDGLQLVARGLHSMTDDADDDAIISAAMGRKARRAQTRQHALAMITGALTVPAVPPAPAEPLPGPSA